MAGFCLAKVAGIDDVKAASSACLSAEARLGMEHGRFSLMPLLETGAAVMDARALARASSRVTALQIGEADLCAEMGINPSPDGHELLHVRSHVVLASRAANIGPPIGPVSTEYSDTAAFRASTLDLHRLGFGSRACIHPAQVAIVNEALSPTDAELVAAQKHLDQYAVAVAAGQGVVGDDAGNLIDRATARQSLRTLAQRSGNPNGERA